MAFRSINPHSPSDVVGEYEESAEKGVEEAVSHARKALAGWREQTAVARGAALASIAEEMEEKHEELSSLIVREVGKPIAEARGEVSRAISILRYYSQVVLAPDGETYPASSSSGDWLVARRHPVGVCALITPWNFPLAIPVWKAAPALAYGNTVVLKPAPQSSAVAHRLKEICERHLPEGVLELVLGDVETGEPLVRHPSVDAVSFTGSVRVGLGVARKVSGRGARVQCEMGGQNPSIVLADADLERAAKTISYAAMGYAGQKCTATSRIIVEEPVYEEFRERIVAVVEELMVVDPEKDDCLVGPLIAEESRTLALEAIEKGGGRVITGGHSLEEEGFYLAPTLIELEDRGSPLVREEVFAPVCVLLRAASAEEALSIANEVRHGLAAAVFTENLAAAIQMTGRLEAGMVRVNASTTGVDYHAPFGGSKGSGVGPTREQGLAAREFYTESRTLLISL
ncbi:aldehyde dehydrogenase [Rubrobacter xylanophilus DSM 9941]|uniref:Aldehyde dehydrogenase n=1 Tax=Rubrobacter xylanophilus (strain DSM 9941 / JCM 11954 / NBRC 16129 / PRD-1) TaxID=266117 RepID=Q1ATU1_RUBXD|nr:aldehyde dehydrogenase family protein [Rubrobacter xylanophilus]ABG05187.1 aldehyde dehydrogenase [Rubrobacter xylanophilus DSM 9941]